MQTLCLRRYFKKYLIKDRKKTKISEEKNYSTEFASSFILPMDTKGISGNWKL